MAAVLIFLLGVAAVVGWWLSQQRLMSKPWLEASAVGELPAVGVSPLPVAKLGLGVFLAVAGSLFALLVSAYVMQMSLAESNVTRWTPLPAPRLLWLNTGMLVLSSAMLHWAKVAARRGEMAAVKDALAAAGASALAFVAGQLLVWQQLAAGGYLPATDPANAFFYLITGVHSLHVLGGLAALGRTGTKVWNATVWHGAAPAKLRLSVELCAIYWHFLLLVWLIIFAMLTGWADNLVAICRAFLA